MKPLAFALALIWALAAWAASAQAQARTTHIVGDGVFSQDGRYIAFIIEGMQQNEFVALDVDSGQSFVFAMARPQAEVRDLAWAPASNTLLFVSRARKTAPRSEWRIDTWMETSVWTIAFAADRPQPARLVARGEEIRLPALSPDGSKLAWFQPVPRPEEAPPNLMREPTNLMAAYGVFEMDIATGAVERVSNAQYNLLRELFYEDRNAWLLGVEQVRYLHRNAGWLNGGMHVWANAQTTGPPAPGTTGMAVSYGSFRMDRGEPSANKSERKHPYPDEDLAPIKSQLVGVTPDGYPILYGAPGPENTALNREYNMARAYGLGATHVEMKEGFIAYGPDGVREVYFPPEKPQGYHSAPGGFGVDAGMKRSFRTGLRTGGDNSTRARFEASRLWVFESGRLILDRGLADIVAKAETVQIAD